MPKNNKDLEERVKNYSKEIRQISDFVAQVRQTPDMYIGKVRGNLAFSTMVREIFQNSVDEILKGNAFTPNIYVSYDESSHTVVIEDNGRGIPHGKIGIIFGTSHTSSNYTKTEYVYSAGKNGCGGSTTNALSHKFIVDSYMLGKGKHVEFNEGHIWDKGEVDIDGEGMQGTRITFYPNEDVIGQVTSTWKDIYDLLAIITPSTPIGTHVEYNGIDSRGVTHSETITNTDGIMAYLINMTQSPFIEPIYIEKDNGTMKIQCMFTYDTSAENGYETIISLNNTCPTDGGTHVDGALDGICKFFRTYMNKIYLANQKNKNKLICSANDIRQGLKLAISTFHLYALYDGQAKSILSNPDMVQFASETIQEGLNEWSKTHSNDLQKICQYFKEVIELRMKSEKEKVKLSSMFSSSLLSGGLPAKYLKPNSRHGNLELVIVEGDSAFGSARDSRDQAVQGIFPIRGKMPNAFTTSREKMLKNEEVTAILSIIGAGYGRNFDINKCKVSRVIIMADADPDGAHIRTLVLTFLMVYCRPLVEAGRVFASLPPLYGVEKGKKNFIFFKDKLEYTNYIQREFSKQNSIKDSKGRILNQKEVVSLLFNNFEYVDELEKISNTYAIDPYLLEDIIVNRNMTNPTKLESKLKKKYRFLNVVSRNNILCIEGICNEKYHEVYLTPALMYDIDRYLSQYINSGINEYYLNDIKCTLYSIMKEFERFTPPKLSRFKGLGEMDPKDLGISTLRPDGNRRLIQYTVNDIIGEVEQMRYICSNKSTLLTDEETD